MNGKYILENGQAVPCTDLMTWGQWMEDNRANRHVGDDTISDHRISTVFLGLDHAHRDGPPLIYETMIFGDHPELGGWQDRYSTWRQAEQGHARACQLVRDKTN